MKNRRVRRWVGLILQAAALGCCLFMAAYSAAQQGEATRIAVLETRTDQVNQHLQNTDLIEDKLVVRLDAQERAIEANSDAIAAIQNDSQWERRIGWAIISLLTGGSMLSNWRKRTTEALEG